MTGNYIRLLCGNTRFHKIVSNPLRDGLAVSPALDEVCPERVAFLYACQMPCPCLLPSQHPCLIVHDTLREVCTNALKITEGNAVRPMGDNRTCCTFCHTSIIANRRLDDKKKRRNATLLPAYLQGGMHDHLCAVGETPQSAEGVPLHGRIIVSREDQILSQAPGGQCQ